MGISENILRLERSIAEAAVRAGRRRDEISYLLVTKTVPGEKVREAVALGITDLGENRVQEMVQKKPMLPDSVRWHMIGHLQTNKVKHVVGQVVLIHSVDRAELVREIEKQARKIGVTSVDCLIQVNSSQEDTKFGVPPREAADLVAAVGDDSPVCIRGLMTIGPLTGETARVRKAFAETRALRDNLREQFPKKQWDILSMGMSGDYEIAIEEGATLLRIGSAVFGHRN
jgi:pyridoxal phosphate enzyme (YggS family)